MTRIADTVRQPPGSIEVDGLPVRFYPGETIAAAMLAANHSAFRRDRHGAPRGLWCNMGTCGECLVVLVTATGEWRVRACLVDANTGQSVRTVPDDDNG